MEEHELCYHPASRGNKPHLGEAAHCTCGDWVWCACLDTIEGGFAAHLGAVVAERAAAGVREAVADTFQKVYDE